MTTDPTPNRPRKRAVWPWVLGAVAAVVVLCCGIGAAATLSNDSPREGTKPVSSGQQSQAAAPTRTSDAPKKYAEPKPDDFKLTVKVLRKKCFGSAGCNVTFRISEVTYTGSPLDPSKEYEVTYEVKGLEDPFTSTFTLYGTGEYEVPEEEFGGTSSSKAKLTATVTSVESL